MTLAMVLTAPATAATPNSRKTFRSETKGVSHPTIQGSWNDDEESGSHEARLQFEGGHAVGEYTSFVGTWVSPPSTSSRQPSLSIDYEVAFSNALGRDINLVQAVRARYARGGWGRWVKARIQLPASTSNVLTDGLDVVVHLAEPERVIYQWKITGKVSGPAALQGDFRLNVN
jgi:hypothetical protein